MLSKTSPSPLRETQVDKSTYSLYQGRSWARCILFLISLPPYSNVFRNPSPPIPQGWPLSWVKQVIQFPEDKLSELRGLDATVYLLFLRACSMSVFCFYAFKLSCRSCPFLKRDLPCCIHSLRSPSFSLYTSTFRKTQSLNAP